MALWLLGWVSLSSCASEATATEASPTAAAATPEQPAANDAPPSGQAAAKSSTGIDTAAGAASVKAGALVLDVRTQGEFDGGAIESAVLIPHTEVVARIDEIAGLVEGDRSHPVVVYCRSGRRSGVAQADLQAAGFTAVVNGGGYAALQKALDAP
jgi:phage shock protein E